MQSLVQKKPNLLIQSILPDNTKNLIRKIKPTYKSALLPCSTALQMEVVETEIITALKYISKKCNQVN